MSQVSVGQASANALSAWLRTALTADVTVFSRWPEANVQLPPKAVSVIKVGKRQRLDVNTGQVMGTRTNISPTQATLSIQIGSFMHPIQIDGWCTNDIDRDDLIAQFDQAFTAGANLTGAAVTDDPVRDGILVPLLGSDGYSGNIDCWFDEPSLDESPDAVQRSEYRVTYFGEARGAFTIVRTVPRLVNATLGIQAYEGAAPAPGQLYDTTTISVNPTPPPATKTTHGTST